MKTMQSIGIDVETSVIPYFHPWQKEAFLCMVGIATEDGTLRTWTFNHDDYVSTIPHRTMIDEIQTEIDKAQRIVGQYLKFDLNWLSHIGIDFSRHKLYCTKLAEYLIEGQKQMPYSLAALSKKYKIPSKIDRVKQYWDAGYNTNEIPLHILTPYLEQDCINTLMLFQRQAPLLQEKGLVRVNTVAQEVQRMLAVIEYNGMRFDKECAQGHVDTMTNTLAGIEQQLKEAFGWDVNLNSGDELSVALFGGVCKRDGTEQVSRTLKSGEVKIRTRKCTFDEQHDGVFKPQAKWKVKKEGFYSTAKDVILQLECKNEKQKEIVSLLTEHSVTEQALSTLFGAGGTKGLISKIQADGCIHPEYNQAVARTGRLTSSNPNGQNMPREGTSPIKTAIVPKFDYIVSADLSQIEWRGAAFLSQDKQMLKEIRSGADTHTDNAINFFGADPNGDPDVFKKIRTTAKIFTFRLLYGGTPYSFFLDYKMPNFPVKKWEEIVDSFYKKYSGLRKWQVQNIKAVELGQGTLVSKTGRLLTFKKFPEKKRGKETGNMLYREQQIKNYPVQSISADIMYVAMMHVYQLVRNRPGIRIIGQIHDAILADCMTQDVEFFSNSCLRVFDKLPELIEANFGIQFNVPLTGEIEVGKRYSDVVEINKNYLNKWEWYLSLNKNQRQALTEQ